MHAHPTWHVLVSVGLLASGCTGPVEPLASPPVNPAATSPASAPPASVGSGTDDEPAATVPPTGDAAAVAERFAEAWVRRSDDPARWWAGVKAWCEDGLAASLRSTDPATIPATRVIGPPRPAGGSPHTGLRFEITTDTGTLILTVAAIGQRWLVSDVDFTRSGT